MDIIPRVPSFGEKLSQNLFGGLSKGYDQGSNFAQQMALQKQKQSLVNKENENAKFSMGLQTLGQMEELLGKGNIGTSLGIGALGNPFRNLGETGREREYFSQLGRSLIPLVSAGVPIRNQREFEEYKKTITNPDASLGQLQGAIDGLKNIFQNKMSSGESQESPMGGKIKFDLKNPEHKSKRDQLLKHFKGDRSKTEEALRREFE
tara:strand:- start:2254 stop:2871 length:618 start_codon:yes stop_codon:yes gene_type:complete